MWSGWEQDGSLLQESTLTLSETIGSSFMALANVSTENVSTVHKVFSSEKSIWDYTRGVTNAANEARHRSKIAENAQKDDGF